MSTTSIGREAESLVARELQKQGYKLITQNWRTRYCEIDLVMLKKDIVYFIEVKYRSSAAHGSGLDYVTPKKLKQMKFAAELWLSTQKKEYDSILLAAEIDQTGSLEIVELEGQ